MNKTTIQIAITAIYKWQERVRREEGNNSSPAFFLDTKDAIKDLKKFMAILDK